MSTKKKLKQISDALKAASATHLGHHKDLEKMQANLDQVRYGKELFPGGKHSGTGGRGKKGPKGKKPRTRPSRADKQFVKARDERKASELAEQKAIDMSNSAILNDSQPTFELNQSRKVLHQVSTGQQAGVGPTGNYPTAPTYVPPQPPPPSNTPPPPPAVPPPPPAVPTAQSMPVNANQQVPMVPQEKRMMRTVKPLEKIPASKRYSNYRNIYGDLQKATIDDSTFAADSTKYTPGGKISSNFPLKYQVEPELSTGWNVRNRPKGV